jgi:hypothetical protein
MMTIAFTLFWLNTNKGTKSDIEIAPAERALDRFSSCLFEPAVQIGSDRVVAMADKLLAGAVNQQVLDLIRTIEALLQEANGPDHPNVGRRYGIWVCYDCSYCRRHKAA